MTTEPLSTNRPDGGEDAATQVLPIAPSTTTPASEDAPPARRRRGPVIALVVAGALLVLLVVAFFVVDAIAKNLARDYVAERIIAVLGLEPDADVAVDLGGGSILLQALTGRVAVVDVEVPEVAFGELVGAATVHAEGVPLDADAPVDRLGIRFTMLEEHIAPLADNVTGLELQSLELEEPEIVARTEFVVFGIPIPIGMGLMPGAQDGRITFTPTTILIDEEEFSAPELADNPLFAAIAGPLLQQQRLCVAQELPRALTVADVEVVGETLVVSITGDGASLGGDLSIPGTCD